jgi:hypothetical protein
MYTPRPFETLSPVAHIPEKFPLFYTNRGHVNVDTDRIPNPYAVANRQAGLAFAGVATAGHSPKQDHPDLCCVTLKGATGLVYACDLPVWPGEILVSSFLPRKLPYIGPLYGLEPHIMGSAVSRDLVEQYQKGADEDTVYKRPKPATDFPIHTQTKFLEQMSLMCAAIDSSVGTFYLKENLWVNDKQPGVYFASTALTKTDLQNLFFYELAKCTHDLGSMDEEYVETKLRDEWFPAIQAKLRRYKQTRTVPREPIDYDIGCVRQSGRLPAGTDVSNFNMFSVVGTSLSFHTPSYKNRFPVIAVYLFG